MYYQSLIQNTVPSSDYSLLPVLNTSQMHLKEHINQVCQAQSNLHLNNHRLKNQFMVDQRHKLAYCRHGKVIIVFIRCLFMSLSAEHFTL